MLEQYTREYMRPLVQCQVSVCTCSVLRSLYIARFASLSARMLGGLPLCPSIQFHSMRCLSSSLRMCVHRSTCLMRRCTLLRVHVPVFFSRIHSRSLHCRAVPICIACTSGR